MDAYAVIATGGKQYLVKADDVIHVERLDTEAGKKHELDRVLAVSDGKALTLGTPDVSGAKVVSSVVEHVRADKVVSFKKKRRKGYTRKQGHRQEQTVLKIESIA